jgi:molecular chaperone DnaJ
MPILRKSSYGDLYIRIIPEVPISLSKKQKELLSEFKELESSKLSPSIKNFFEKAKKLWGSN